MVKKYALLIFVSLALLSSYSRAQESVIDEVSYVFLEKLVATAKENYPRVNGFESRIKSAKSVVSREQLSWLDAFSFSYVYNPNNTLDIVNPSFFAGYQVAFNFNLSSLLQKPSNVRGAKESVRLAEFDMAEYNLTLETEVKRRYFAYVQALKLLKLQTRMLSDALNMSKDSKAKYEKSEITFDIYTGSQMSYTGALQSMIGAETNYLTAKVSLEELLTKKVEEVR